MTGATYHATRRRVSAWPLTSGAASRSVCEMSAPRRPGFAADLTTTPNLITLSRIVLIVVAAGLFFGGYRRMGVVLGAVAGWTDYLDGWLARRTGQVTRLGEIL